MDTRENQRSACVKAELVSDLSMLEEVYRSSRFAITHLEVVGALNKLLSTQDEHQMEIQHGIWPSRHASLETHPWRLTYATFSTPNRVMSAPLS